MAVFKDFDNPSGGFESLLNQINDSEALNFLLEFSENEARVAFNLTGADVPLLVETSGRATHMTRWINIWAPDKQSELITLLAKTYNFSARLTSLMLENPRPQAAAIAQIPALPKLRYRAQARFTALNTILKKVSNCDVEKNLEADSTEATQDAVVDQPLELNHYRLVNEVWHYSSVDPGNRYLCVGYNSLHRGSSPNSENLEEGALSSRDCQDFPKGKRIWSWLILCDDDTVISIYEDAYFGIRPLNSAQTAALTTSRRNLANVFRELSKSPTAIEARTAMSTLQLRSQPPPSAGDTSSASNSASADAPGLLFYYLFDDWNSSYGLVARKEQQYGAQLDQVRARMIQKPELNDIDSLHRIGRQLAVLRRIYQSYKLIIDRILEKQERKWSSTSDATNPRLAQEDDSNCTSGLQSNLRPSPAPHTVTSSLARRSGPHLTLAAVHRFERLRDRVALYALGEIEECIDQTNSLVSMSFNLIAMKESQAVERLTRITILLAKGTAWFLPISLMTAYFSMQLRDLPNAYSQRDYWIIFAVLSAITLGFLASFSYLSGTMEGSVIYQSLTESVFKKIFGRGLHPGKKVTAQTG